MEFTKEELQFLINVLAEINVAVKNPNAGDIIAKAQSCINKLSKMIDALPQENLDKKEEVVE